MPSFDARVTVQSDRRVEVKEKIVYDFKDRERHGIYRVIPYSYQAETATYEARISSVMVYDGEGNPLPFVESKGNGELTLKIGDPEDVVTGTQTYIISYVVEGPFLFFPEQDEFYWNVTGVWQQGIVEANVLVDLPAGAQVIDAACFRGTAEEDRACEKAERVENDRQAGYRVSVRDLAPGEGLAVAVIFPKGVIAYAKKPWSDEKRSFGARMAALPYAPYIPHFPALVPLVAMGVLASIWYARVRGPRGNKRVPAVSVPPEGVSPALAGIVYRESIGPRDIVAELVRLAVDGYLRVHRVDRMGDHVCTTDHVFESVREDPPADPIHVLILERLFVPEHLVTERIGGRDVRGVSLVKLLGASQTAYEAFVDRLYEQVVSWGYVPGRPGAVRMRYYAFGAAVCVFGVTVYTLDLAVFGAAACLLGVMSMLAGWLMPMQTRAGIRLRNSLEGFRRHLETLDGPADDRPADRELFSRYLPYAIALGADRVWAERHSALPRDAFEWFDGGTLDEAAEIPATALIRSFAIDAQAVLSCNDGTALTRSVEDTQESIGRDEAVVTGDEQDDLRQPC